MTPGASGPTYPAGRNPACSTLFLGDPNKQLEKSFLSAKANVVLRNDGTYGIDVDTLDVKSGADEELSKTLNVLDGDGGSVAQDSTFPLQVQRLTQNLFGSADQGTESTADDLPFMTMPTSCGAKTLSSDATFHASGTVFTDGFGFTPTGCDTVPFAPQIVGSIDGSGGNSREGGHPAIDVTINQALGESATKTAAVQLPPLFGVSLTALGNTCTEANVQANACPAGATVGSAVATSPLSPTPLAGPVLLVEVPNALPKLSVFLFGAANVRLDGNVSLVNGALVNTFDNIAELPLTSFRLTLKGGEGGLLQNSQDLCTGVGSLSGTFTGYNGATVPATAALTGIGIEPCIAAAARKPKAKITFKDVDSGDPKLNVIIRRGSTDNASLLTRAKDPPAEGAEGRPRRQGQAQGQRLGEAARQHPEAHPEGAGREARAGRRLPADQGQVPEGHHPRLQGTAGQGRQAREVQAPREDQGRPDLPDQRPGQGPQVTNLWNPGRDLPPAPGSELLELAAQLAEVPRRLGAGRQAARVPSDEIVDALDLEPPLSGRSANHVVARSQPSLAPHSTRNGDLMLVGHAAHSLKSRASRGLVTGARCYVRRSGLASSAMSVSSLNLKAKGDLAELKVAADLRQRGYKIAIPYGEDWDFDLIVCRDERFERVQVKYTDSDGEIILVRCCSHSLTNGKVRATKQYTAEIIDWIAVFDATSDRCYYVPAVELGEGMSTLTLRITPAKNCQRVGTRPAENYLEF